MPPRKKPSSSSKKSNPISEAQPSKFGIQRFFERHTQNALLASQKQPTNDESADRPVSAPQDSKSVAPLNYRMPSVTGSQAVAPNNLDSVLPRADYNLNSDMGGPKMGSSELQTRKDILPAGANEFNNVSQNTPSENLLIPGFDAVENLLEASPGISKIVSHKRSKFSPGMFIKQSQDDGVDEVTWKISPVNERLQAVSKHTPQIIQALAESSRINLLPVGISSENQTSLTKGGKFEKLLASPVTKAAERSTVSKYEKGLKRIKPDQDMVFDVSSTTANDSGVITGQSPFRTPPSLSYCSDKVIRDVENNGLSDQLYLRQHKKALLELLDQVEDAICVENATICDKNANYIKPQDAIADNLPIRVDCAAESTIIHTPREAISGSNSNYLVLEVSEKHQLANSSALQSPCKVLRLINEQTGEEKAVNLLEEWSYSVVAPGDTVNIIGQFDDQGLCGVDHDNNFLIVHPDILVSGSRVAASFTCPRRTVLDERLKYNEYSIAALNGTLLHQIFQAGLIKDSPTINFLEEYARLVLQRNIESLYACGVNENDVHKTLIDAIPRMLNWIKLFKNSEEKKDAYVDFGCDNGIKKVEISEVIDIEEMAWAPKYGLKGMIDASVSVKVLPKGNEDEKVMPLEFKTGKAMSGQSSIEHRAQVILYTLLMSERYLKNIDSGLLYYLRSDQTEGIVVQRSDLVGLIMRRNELASDILRALTTQQLPPMLQSPSICRGCRHLNVCSIYHKVQGGSAKSSGLGDLFDSHTNHLSSTYSKFLCHWDRLIDLEAKETELVKKEMWRSHTFKMSDGDPSIASTNYLDIKLRSGDYVILSTESSRQAIASGVITDISHAHVSASFSKRLRIPGSLSTSQDLYKQVWRIDKDETVTSFAVMRFNLVQLFLQNDQSAHLRKMIVDLEAPKFDSGSMVSQDPAISYVWSEKSLNDDQRRSILKILTAKDYALILGMPGTGKTSTMVHAVKALLIRGTSILLTAYTNSAVDNLLIKLKAQGIDFVRIGRHEAVHEEVREHCLSATNVQNVDEIKVRLEQVKVVAVTCLGITSPLLANRTFDVCIMDEAGQTTLPVSLGPLMFSSMFVLVGDHYQLPPLVQSAEARENGMGVSLFCRLSEAHPQAISALQSQYRMCQGIMDLSNALIYGDRLSCGSTEIANAKLEFSTLKWGLPWLKNVLNPDRPVIFIDTDKLPALEAREQKTINNPVEAHIIVEIAKALIKNGIGEEQVGIITPYNSQANLIRQAACVTSLEIHTIDKYQGRDKDCILVSFVRSSENPSSCASSLLGDWHRINVALTRGKKKLIMAGSCRTLSKVPLLKLLIKKVEQQSGIISLSKKDIYQKGELKRCSHMR
ncbi:DNA replication ATP-dependent helicase/nuclease DNA2 isoform X2 [Neltuma alba]|uniref:DNA replication ATP-dependent helicase/nuclease DNA2 isoform X2 n=2 Tax=Neltuma alba TaxID=207710 RepID=UPI0010A44C86|nr:DNA replication ATP-dependent helicase/nuclease DNA2 isoform X2 [Prosopis alba]